MTFYRAKGVSGSFGVQDEEKSIKSSSGPLFPTKTSKIRPKGPICLKILNLSFGPIAALLHLLQSASTPLFLAGFEPSLYLILDNHSFQVEKIDFM